MEKIDFYYFKILAIYSLALGAICALISLIPSFMPFFSLCFLPFFGCIIPLLFLILKNGLNIKEVKTFAVLGSLSGIFICIGFLLIFLPVVRIIVLIFKNYYSYGIPSLNFFLIVMFFVMIAIVYGVTNAVAGLVTGGIYNYFKGRENGKNN